jgi:hypothetical protein
VYSKLAFQGTENQWIRNYIIAQEYIYEHADASVVIAGTSLSTRLYPFCVESFQIFEESDLLFEKEF